MAEFNQFAGSVAFAIRNIINCNKIEYRNTYKNKPYNCEKFFHKFDINDTNVSIFTDVEKFRTFEGIINP